MPLRLLSAPVFFGQKTECMMRRRNVLIELACFFEVSPRLLEVAATQFDIPEVHPGLDETRTVFERYGETGLGRGEVSTKERLGARGIELDRPPRERRRGRAGFTGKQSKKTDHRERLHVQPYRTVEPQGCVPVGGLCDRLPSRYLPRQGMTNVTVASHEDLFLERSESRCDACGESLPPTDEGEGAHRYGLPGRALYLWARGDEVRFEGAPLCAACASAIGMTALARWEIEEEEG